MWLLYVLAAQIRAEQLAFIEVGILVLSLFVWMTQLKFKRAFGKRFAYAGLLAAIVAMFSISLDAEPPTASGAEQSSGLIAWTTFDRSEAESLAREGRLVFVDVTADWCFTCKANERLVLHTEAVADAFERHGVIPMQADWTNRSDEIAQYLADYGRYSVPFYMLHRPDSKPHLFGEILRKKEILRVLEESGARAVHQVAAD